MSQSIWTSINPLTTSGLMLAGLLDDFKDALMTGCSGTSRPSALQAGGVWIDTTNQAAPTYTWAFKMYTGATDVEIFRISILNGFGGTLTADSSFEVQEIADDTAGPIFDLVKNRITNNGQVLSGDTVAQIRFIGRTDTSTNPTVAYLRFIASENMTSSAYGGSFSLYSTPDASATIAEHLKFAGGVVESTAPYAPNSVEPEVTSVATAASIAQLTAATSHIDMTGSTDTTIHGINYAGNAKVVLIRNLSSAEITLENESPTAAAEDRMKFPYDIDVTIGPDGSAHLFYSENDSRWKLLSATGDIPRKSITEIRGHFNQWTASHSGQIRVTAYPPRASAITAQHFVGARGEMYAYGNNNNGRLGVGDTTPRSSPVLVLGGLTWAHPRRKVSEIGGVRGALTTSGDAYMWGLNTKGGLGVGDTTPRSSPVAVLGGLKFSHLVVGGNTTLGLTTSGIAYAWGRNASGELGIGDVTARSSPVAVLGGLKFSQLVLEDSSATVFGITSTGAAYAWGRNQSGQLGHGDVDSKSSPVAVLGGISFKKIVTRANTSGGFTVGLSTAGALYAWGDNVNGQLGVGDTTSRSSPVAVLGGYTFTDFEVLASTASAGGSAYALTEDGTLYAWGLNDYGQLGLGDLSPRSSPVAVLGGLKFASVTPIFLGAIGLTTEGAAYGWGYNDGLLGLNDTAPRSSPVAVVGGVVFDGIFAREEGGASSVYGLANDGKLYSWGQNEDGVLAVGDVANRSSPTLVSGPHSCGVSMAVKSTVIRVTAGTTYDVVLSQHLSTFGASAIGYGVDRITIEYET